jgi:hypothetical protein
LGVGDSVSTYEEDIDGGEELELYAAADMLQPGDKSLPYLRSVTLYPQLSHDVARLMSASHGANAETGCRFYGGLFGCSLVEARGAETLFTPEFSEKVIAPFAVGASVFFNTNGNAMMGYGGSPVHVAFMEDVLLPPKICLIGQALHYPVVAGAAFNLVLSCQAVVEVAWRRVTDAQGTVALVSSLQSMTQ